MHEAVGEHNEGRSQKDIAQIVTGIGHILGICSGKSRDLGQQKQSHSGGKHTGKYHGPGAEMQGPSRVLLFSLSQKPGNHTAAAHAKHTGDGHNDQQNRGAQRHCGNHGWLLGQGDKKGIRHVVDQSGQLSQHSGQAHPQNSLRQILFLKNRCHNGHSSLQTP